MKRIYTIAFITISVLIIAACQPQSQAEPKSINLTISVAASLTDVMEALREEYSELQPHVRLTFNMGPSGQLQQQIEQGAPVDVFISAAQRNMDTLEQKELIVSNSRIDVLRNELVLIVQVDTGNINGFEDLLKTDVKHIGIGNPGSVPAGQYAKEALDNLRLWDELSPKLAEGQNVRTVLSYVETGNAEAGFVYRSDAMVSNKVKIVTSAPEGSVSPILYPAAVVTSSQQVDSATAFVEFLQSEIAIGIFEQFGFKRI